MRPRFAALLLAAALAAAPGAAQTEHGPYARIAVLRPHDGKTVDFEAGYVRHLEWHRQAKDPWSWYGWSIWAGERQRFFVYATFGHAAASFDNPVAPADDERDNILNVAPHVEWAGNALYEFLPQLSRGTGEPSPTPRLELTTVDLVAAGSKAFETALVATSSTLVTETLWYRMVAGGPVPRYVRFRPRPRLSAILAAQGDQDLPDGARSAVARTTVEILVLRPTLSLNLPAPPRD
jgi:hypothetical protein